jgi:DNA polymerase
VTTSQRSSQQQAYLQAMGIQGWVRRQAPHPQAQPELVEGEAAETVQRAETVTAPRSQSVAPRPEPVETLPPAPLADEPPLPTEEYASSIEPAPAPQEHAVVDSGDRKARIARLDWPQLEAAVKSCTACELHTTRTQAVFGVGDPQAQWMVIGEAPGAEEDKQGEPFVGRAGKLLDNMLRAVGLQREQVYIANILKCRPPNNRDPRPEEIVQCEAFLQRQVALVQPRVILAVGRVAAGNLLKLDKRLGEMRGRVHHYGDTPVVVTYHPAYLLRTPRDKAKAWADLRLARRIVSGEMGDGQ